jgi:hypothetical protein
MVLVGTLVTVEAPRTAKLAKSGPRIGAAKAPGAVAIWKRTDAAAQRRKVLTLLTFLFINPPFSSILARRRPWQGESLPTKRNTTRRMLASLAIASSSMIRMISANGPGFNVNGGLGACTT